MNYTKLPKKALLLLATPVLLTLAVPATRLMAQSQTETKIRLMADALRARDNGDLPGAKANLEQLLVLAPGDVQVQRLLDGVNASIAGTPAVTAAPVAADTPVEVTYNPNAKPAKAPKAAKTAKAEKAASDKEAAKDQPVAASPSVDPVVLNLSQEEEAALQSLIQEATAARAKAAKLAKAGDFAAADGALEDALAGFQYRENVLTKDTIAAITKDRNAILLQKSQAQLAAGDIEAAKATLDAYIKATSVQDKGAVNQIESIEAAELNPSIDPVSVTTPEFHEGQKKIAQMQALGRSQYAAGALDEAQQTFRSLETLSTDNPEAKYFLARISEDKARLGTLDRQKSRTQMLEEVAKAWQRPGVFEQREVGDTGSGGIGGNDALKQKLSKLIIPSVSFVNNDLGEVVNTLSALSEELDTSGDSTKGVNLVLGSALQGAAVPPVNLSLRNMSLKRILDIVTDQVGYTYVVQEDVVRLSPTGQDNNLSTEEFSVPRSALTRMTGMTGAGPTPAAAGASTDDPFAAPAAAATPTASAGGESDAIRRFLQAAGVPFDSVAGSSLVYDGSRIIVTHTQRNLERVRNILARYKDDIRQVEIEAKFIDVNHGVLDELGVTWGINGRGSPIIDPTTGLPTLDSSGNPTIGNYKTTIASQNRSIAAAISGQSTTGSSGTIIRNADGSVLTLPGVSPNIPGSVNVAGNAGDLLGIVGSIGEFDISAKLRALSQTNGSDLLSAPKVSVLSGEEATISVVQRLEYPDEYEQPEDIQVSGSGTGTTVNAGLQLQGLSPSSWKSEDVGVSLRVTPVVDDDNYSITMTLNPRVTELEGFVEYGSPSLAIFPNGTTAQTPSGGLKPVFNIREITTRVTVWDGATLVMGGLTREEVRRVEDKVPVLGDIPFLGRAFKSKGEATQKRNLLIFVTANLVSPGGSLKKQELRGTGPGAVYQNPSVVTPGGPESRIRNN